MAFTSFDSVRFCLVGSKKKKKKKGKLPEWDAWRFQGRRGGDQRSREW